MISADGVSDLVIFIVLKIIAHPSEKYHEKSHGESFLELAQNQLKANGLYLFDEPELYCHRSDS